VQEFQKHEDDVLDYQFDWSEWLNPLGDTILSSQFSVEPIGPALTSPTNDNYTTKVWVGGGTDQGNYKLLNTITTTGGRTKTAHMTIRIRNTQ